MKERRTYAATVTKEYLMKLGITNVTPDGYHVYKGDKEIGQHLPKSSKVKRNYLQVMLYDPELRQTTPKEERTHGTGAISVPVHVINYVWNKGDRPEGMVVDHIDNNPLNNHISNLQLLTQKENLAKERGESTRQIPCKLDKPLSYYEDRLNNYVDLYEAAKKAHDADTAHKLRTNISQTQARIRYYLAHTGKATELQVQKEAAKTKSELYHAKADCIKLLNEVIEKKHTAYNDAKAILGAKHYRVSECRAEWKQAIGDLKEFTVSTRYATPKQLAELINFYTERAQTNF